MTLLLDATLPSQLQDRMSNDPPGRFAQRVCSHELSYGRHFGPPRLDARRAAVLVLLRWDGKEWLLPLTKRPETGEIHSGQICFAGGGIESDETDIQAALRECREETGWTPQEEYVLGRLSPLYVYASNNLVSSVVAATAERPVWNPDEREVAELIELPLGHLCSDSDKHETIIERFGVATRARCFVWNDYEIWGATAMILSELKAIILK